MSDQGRLGAAVESLARAQKPGGGVPAYMRWVNRPLGRRVAAAGYVAGMRPNDMTLLSASCSLAGMAVLLFAGFSWPAGFVIALLFVAAFACDSADGQLARLSNRAGPAGEWLDHVVDAVRTPAVHVAVGISAWQYWGLGWQAVVALAMSVVASGQFMSQMLAEQLQRHQGGLPRRGGDRQSFVLLPTDPGVWALSFVLWGSPAVFAVAYSLLAVLNLAHTAVSMRRRYRELVRLAEDGS
jgi:phosphatidylglycerophosphate synthase